VTKDATDILIRPVVSEKSYALMESGVYVFVVAPESTKIDVRRAVEGTFGVRVAHVNTLNRKGKKRRNRRTNTVGTRSDTKRAVVTLAGDDRIDLFEKN
jgi:large subunit ribosomal protein L23